MQTAVAPEEARAIAKEAYIYANPLVDSYRILYSYFVDEDDSDFKAPWNQIKNIPRVYTPDDRAVQTPNSDTPYSWLGLDLRAEPVVLTVPPIMVAHPVPQSVGDTPLTAYIVPVHARKAHRCGGERSQRTPA